MRLKQEKRFRKNTYQYKFSKKELKKYSKYFDSEVYEVILCYTIADKIFQMLTEEEDDGDCTYPFDYCPLFDYPEDTDNKGDILKEFKKSVERKIKRRIKK